MVESAPRKLRTAMAGGVPRRALRAPPSDAVIAPSGAVEADSFEWTCSSDNYCPWPSSYRFVMRNKTNRDLANITYEIVFLNSANNPVHSIQSTLTDPLRANLAKIVSNDGLQGNGVYPGHDVRSMANAVQISYRKIQLPLTVEVELSNAGACFSVHDVNVRNRRDHRRWLAHGRQHGRFLQREDQGAKRLRLPYVQDSDVSLRSPVSPMRPRASKHSISKRQR